MEDLWLYITEGGITGLVIFALWKWGVPLVKNLYNELQDLRKENTSLKEKNARLESKNEHLNEKLDYFKSKYMDKVVLKSHGKKKV